MQVPHGMRGSRNFHQGGPGQLTKKGSHSVIFFFFFFLSSAYFTEVKWSISKKYTIFQRSRGGPTFYQGGSNFFQGGSNCLLPLETHITCDFPGGSGPPVPPPLDPHLHGVQKWQTQLDLLFTNVSAPVNRVKGMSPTPPLAKRIMTSSTLRSTR